MKTRLLKLGVLAAGAFTSTLCTGIAQNAAPATPPAAHSSATAEPTAIQTEPDLFSFPDLREKAIPLMDKARAGDGSASITLARYNGHYTMLTARTASGGAELHKHYADFLFVLTGQGTELTGGTIIDRKDGDNGEVKGSRLDGAVPRALQKGDVVHIPAGTPHQMIEGPGQSITIFVVKVEQP